jgi:hypothetical protein
MALQIRSTCGNGFDGARTMFPFPASKEKAKEKAKFTGTLEGAT